MTLLLLMLSGGVAYREYGRSISYKTQQFASEIGSQLAQRIAFRMAQIEQNSALLVESDQVQSEFSHYMETSLATQERARMAMRKTLLDEYDTTDYINQKYFLDQTNLIINSQVLSELGHDVEKITKLNGATKKLLYWGSIEGQEGHRAIFMLRGIYFKQSNRVAGSLFLGVRTSYFSSIFENVNLGPGSNIYILDSQDGKFIAKTGAESAIFNGTAVSHSISDPILKKISEGDRSGSFDYTFFGQNASGTNDGRATAESGGYPFLATFTQIPHTSWCVVSTIPYENITTIANHALKKCLLIGFAGLICALILAYIIANSITTPLYQVIASVNEAMSGHFCPQMPHQGKDEITELAYKINALSSVIEQNREKLEARVAERTQELENVNLQLEALSLTDSLTGIPNRRRFDQQMGIEWRRAARTTKPLALLLLDVDFFKNYNDHYGHQDGDSCLRKVARLLQSHAGRASDMVARYGGEEFVMLLADTDSEQALALAENIRFALETLALPHAQSAFGCVTISIGVAVTTPDETETPEMFIRMSDKAMYQAKANGRNQVVLFRKK